MQILALFCKSVFSWSAVVSAFVILEGKKQARMSFVVVNVVKTSLYGSFLVNDFKRHAVFSVDVFAQ